jgi:uncharacterized repeat protein (TIGR02543 family)
VATALAGYTFSGWSGDLTGTSPSLSVAMTSNVYLVASFSALLPQAITWVPPGPLTTRSPAFLLSVSASSGLPVTLALENGPASLMGHVVVPAGSAGTVILLATQSGNLEYLPAAPLLITLQIGAAPPGTTLTDDSSATKRSDRLTRVTSLSSERAD